MISTAGTDWPTSKRELLPWEFPISGPAGKELDGLMAGLSMAASMAMTMGARMPRERIRAAPIVRKEDAKTKRLHKAQRTARKAERRGRK